MNDYTFRKIPSNWAEKMFIQCNINEVEGLNPYIEGLTSYSMQITFILSRLFSAITIAFGCFIKESV